MERVREGWEVCARLLRITGKILLGGGKKDPHVPSASKDSKDRDVSKQTLMRPSRLSVSQLQCKPASD
jgi:hypothetical protein